MRRTKKIDTFANKNSKPKEVLEENLKEASREEQFVNLFNMADSQRLQPIVKWAGGKENELKYILPNLPAKFTNFYDPFVGGGAVYTAIKAKKYFINDKSSELIALYRMIKSKDESFYSALDEISHNWQILSKLPIIHSDFFLKLYKDFSDGLTNDRATVNYLFEFLFKKSFDFNGMFSAVFNFDIEHFIAEIKKNLIRKMHRMNELEKIKGQLTKKGILDNIETAFKSAFYMHFRHIYNNISEYDASEGFKTAIFLFIRNNAYSGMFRYNASGGFNVPYGGIGYNRKNSSKKISYYKSKELEKLLNNTEISCLDFEDFFKKYQPKKSDFVFIDPPYDSEFSTYAQNEFTKIDQERLANYLVKKCKAKWMIIIKNTSFVLDLYSKQNLNIKSFDKKYLVSFMNRNDKNVEHLIIKNY